MGGSTGGEIFVLGSGLTREPAGMGLDGGAKGEALLLGNECRDCFGPFEGTVVGVARVAS